MQRHLWQMRQPLCQEHDQQWAGIQLPVNLDHVSHKSRSIFSYCNHMKGMSQEIPEGGIDQCLIACRST